MWVDDNGEEERRETAQERSQSCDDDVEERERKNHRPREFLGPSDG
jgi:hypothetical protein